MMRGVHWLPPWPFAERQRWAEANPGLAGFYFGLALAVYFGVWATVFTRVGVGVGIMVWQIGTGWVTVVAHDQVKGKNAYPGRVIWNIEAPDVKGDFDRLVAAGATVVREPY